MWPRPAMCLQVIVPQSHDHCPSLTIVHRQKYFIKCISRVHMFVLKRSNRLFGSLFHPSLYLTPGDVMDFCHSHWLILHTSSLAYVEQAGHNLFRQGWFPYMDIEHYQSQRSGCSCFNVCITAARGSNSRGTPQSTSTLSVGRSAGWCAVQQQAWGTKALKHDPSWLTHCRPPYLQEVKEEGKVSGRIVFCERVYSNA